MHLTILFLLILSSALYTVTELSPVLLSTNTDLNNISDDGTQDYLQTSEVSYLEVESSKLDNATIEEVKSRILSALHMENPPRRHPRLPPLQSLFSQDSSLQNESSTVSDSRKVGKKTEFIFATVDETSCFDASGKVCIRFHVDLPSSLGTENEVTAELWLYKKSGVTELEFTQIANTSNHKEERQVVIAENQSEAEGWTRFEVTSLLKNISFGLSLEISGDSVGMPLDVKDNKLPFLLLLSDSDNEIHGIEKRSVGECTNESSTCCRKKLYVTFKEIGWDDWIVHPAGYDANYCYGLCNSSFDKSRTHHATIMMRFCMNNPNGAAAAGIEGSCTKCSPSAHKPISIIYLDEEGVEVVSHVPDMSVTECSCV